MLNIQIYKIQKAVQITGLPHRRIQFFIEIGLVNIGDKAPGRGHGRLLNAQNIFELLLISELSHQKVELSRIREIMMDLPKKRPGLKKRLNLINLIEPDMPNHHIVLWPDGSVKYLSQGYSGEMPAPTKKKVPEKILIDMGEKSSALVINVSYIAKMATKKIAESSA